MGINKQFFKSIVYGLLGLALMVSLMSLLFPSKVLVARSVQFAADNGAVIEQVGKLENWKNWHPVFQQINMQINGSMAQWESNGKNNTIEITKVDSSAVYFLTKRVGENDIENIVSVKPISGSNEWNVDWLAVNKLKWYPWEKFAGMFIDKISGQGYQQALEGLKQYLVTKN